MSVWFSTNLFNSYLEEALEVCHSEENCGFLKLMIIFFKVKSLVDQRFVLTSCESKSLFLIESVCFHNNTLTSKYRCWKIEERLAKVINTIQNVHLFSKHVLCHMGEIILHLPALSTDCWHYCRWFEQWLDGLCEGPQGYLSLPPNSKCIYFDVHRCVHIQPTNRRLRVIAKTPVESGCQAQT